MRLTTESLNLKAKSLYVTLNFIVFIPSRSIRSVKCWQIFPELEFIQSNSKRLRQSSFLHAAPHYLNSAWNRLKLKGLYIVLFCRPRQGFLFRRHRRRSKVSWSNNQQTRLQVVPHFSSEIVERAKRERSWESLSLSPPRVAFSRVGCFSCALAFRSLYYPWGQMGDYS